MAYVVPGVCTVKTGAQGTGGSLSSLGITVEGVRVAFQHHKRPIMTDAAGTEVPAEMQKMGITARISGRLVNYDAAVWKALLQWGGATFGQQLAAGTLLLTNSGCFRVVLDCATPLRFYYCTLGDGQAELLSTKAKEPEFEFEALLGVGADLTLAGKQTWDETVG